jgi:diguanylate cyclase (GGDEF)-like protein/PAS domain S-box-containing protein
VMSRPVKTILADASLCDATRRLKEARIRHFLVVRDDGAIAGVISQTDLVLNQGVEYFLHLKHVQSAIGRSLLRLPENLPVSEVASRLRQRGADAAAVLYRDGEHGIITERDIVKLICEGRFGAEVGSVASRPLVTVPENASLFHARNVLAERHIRHLGVTNADGDLIALLSFPDILNTIEQGYIQELQSTLRQREEALTLSRGRLRLVGKVFESTADGIVITDSEGVVQSANPAFLRLTGYEEHEIVGRNARIFSSGRQDKAFYGTMWSALKTQGYWKGEIWNRKKSGEIYLKTMTVTGIRDTDGKFCNYAAVHSDVISHEQNLERVHYLANHDALTGLPNRSHFNDRLIRAINHGQRRKCAVGVMIVDLDRFGSINETLGYLAGDELLQAISAMLTSRAGDGTMVARLSGDQFALVIEDCEGADALADFAKELLSAVARPMTLGDCPLYVTASVGISLYPSDSADAHVLVQRAITAAEQAKTRGRNTYQFFTEEMNRRARHRLSIEADLRRAIDRGELRIHYQPKIDMHRMMLSGAEALVRWQHPDRGLLAPGEFIPVAEEAGLVAGVNEWVLETACRDARRWWADGYPVPVAVNLSPCQFHQRQLGDVVRRALARSGLTPEFLELEITENMAMENAEETFHTLAELVSVGVSFSIDDFGTGYSSFSYLKRYPVSTLKIDRSFIQDITAAEHVAIPQAIISMAHSLGMKVVAEGVETEYQLDALKACNCDIGQGFLFSRPLPPDQFLEFCQRAHPASQASQWRAVV